MCQRLGRGILFLAISFSPSLQGENDSDSRRNSLFLEFLLADLNEVFVCLVFV